MPLQRPLRQRALTCAGDRREAARMSMEPVLLEGRYVRLEPLTLEHAGALWAVSDHAELYRYKPYVLRSEDDLRRFITAAQAQQASGTALAFATVAVTGNDVVGS